MFRVLANDGLEEAGADALRKHGFEVVTEHYANAELKDRIGDFDVLIVRSATKVRKELIDAAKDSRLKLVIRAGVGVDNIDVDYAETNGVRVRNTPNASSASVAELALGHMLALARHIHAANVTIKRGEWNKNHYQGTELAGKTLGLVGFGRIAQSLAQKANALGMNVVYNDLCGPVECSPAFRYVEIEELLRISDHVSLHIPHCGKRGAVIGEKEFGLMKETAYLINTARGGVVDEEALVEALDSGKIAAAALDVYVEEPIMNEAIMNHPKISLTPHLGASTNEAQERIGVEVTQTVLEFFNIG